MRKQLHINIPYYVTLRAQCVVYALIGIRYYKKDDKPFF